MSGLILSVVEGLGQDYLVDKANEYAEEHFQPVKDPFYEKVKLPNGDTKEIRRKLPKDLFGKKESRAWKSIQNRAWMHDRSMCGCCCWTDTIGWAPLLALLPVIGPGIMYLIHNKLITQADKAFKLPLELKAKMHGNIVIDLCISLVPLLGTLFSWLHACSTRNAAMVYNYVVQRAVEQKQTISQGTDNSRSQMTQPTRTILQQQKQKQRYQTNTADTYQNNRAYQHNDRNHSFNNNNNHQKIHSFEMRNLSNEHNNTNKTKNQASRDVPTVPPRARYYRSNNDYVPQPQPRPQPLVAQQVPPQQGLRYNQQQVYHNHDNIGSTPNDPYARKKPVLPYPTDE